MRHQLSRPVSRAVVVALILLGIVIQARTSAPRVVAGLGDMSLRGRPVVPIRPAIEVSAFTARVTTARRRDDASRVQGLTHCGTADACDAMVRLAVAPNPNAMLAAPPSVSVDTLRQAVADVQSPLADGTRRREGRTLVEYLWDRGRAVGIDPAVAMAIFWTESHYGTLGIATLTHSLSNMRPVGAQPALCSADGCYADEPDWFAGIDDIYTVLRHYRQAGISSVDQLAPLWAPAADGNDVAAYMESAHERIQSLDAASVVRG